MFSKTQWISGGGIVTLALVMMVSPVSAQTGVTPFSMSMFPEEMDEARDLFNLGERLYTEQKFAEAEKRFREVLQKFPRNVIADRSNYYLIRTLVSMGKVSEALAQINQFERVFPRSAWRSDVQEMRIGLTNEVSPAAEMLILPEQMVWQVSQTPVGPVARPASAAPEAPQAPAAPAAPTPFAFARSARAAAPGGQAREAVSPEVSLQQEILRALFQNDAERGIAIATERLRSDPSDPVALSSLHLIANSRSEQAIPMLVTLAKNSSNVKARRDAIFWIGRSRAEKEVIADTLVGLVPSMTADDDSEALAQALSSVNVPKATEALATMARDSSKSDRVRQNALRWIAQSRLTNRMALLQEIYRSAMDNTALRRQVVQYYSQTRDESAVAALAGVARQDPDQTVRRQAVSSLGSIRTPEALKALEDLLARP